MSEDFIMEIEEVDCSTNRGIFIQGKISKGEIHLGSSFEIIGDCVIIKTIVASIEKIEKNNKIIRRTISSLAKSGDTVRLLLSNSYADGICIGQKLSKPHIFGMHSVFKANISFYNEEDIYDVIYRIFTSKIGFSKNFSTNVNIYSLSTAKEALSEDTFEVLVEMEQELAIKLNLEFNIYKKDKKIGTGIVTEIIE